ncbi:MAG: serine/threonine protein phosphatase [Clostridiales bacterium]|nr:serine/threonine protein phosphatase [Clostridiales bacterium]
MALFAIADTHLSFGVDKPMEIFPGWQDFEKRLENNWRRLVEADDTVVIAGDISWGMTLEEALPDFAFLDSLPGRKILLKGNHDYWWNSKSKMDVFFEDKGFKSLHILHNNAYVADSIAICGTRGWSPDNENPQDQKILLREANRLKMSIEAARAYKAKPVAFLHYPPVFAGQECRAIREVLEEEGIERCYFGHLHAQAFKGFAAFESGGVKYDLISADYLEFCPKHIA